jgi:hypothetical protein
MKAHRVGRRRRRRARRALPWQCPGPLPVGGRRRPRASALRGRGIRPIPTWTRRLPATSLGVRGRARHLEEERRCRDHAGRGNRDPCGTACHLLSPSAPEAGAPPPHSAYSIHSQLPREGTRTPRERGPTRPHAPGAAARSLNHDPEHQQHEPRDRSGSPSPPHPEDFHPLADAATRERAASVSTRYTGTSPVAFLSPRT